jgi:TrmH family RNA methyltransferase
VTPALVGSRTPPAPLTPPAASHVLALRSRRTRDETGTFYAEGVRFLVAAVDARADIVGLVLAPKLLRSGLGQMAARRLRGRGIPELRVTPEEFAALSTSREPQGVGVIVRQRWSRLDDMGAAHDACWVALSDVMPGNLGTLLRTCDAVGASGLAAIGREVDPHDPVVVRASMGSVFGRCIVRAGLRELVTFARRAGCLVVGVTPRATLDYRAQSFRRPVVLLLGSERRGLTHDEERACDVTVGIPMVARIDSLNVAVAASVLLYEVYGQRHPLARRRG